RSDWRRRRLSRSPGRFAISVTNGRRPRRARRTMGRIKPGIFQKSLGLPFRRSLPAAQKLGASALELEASRELLPRNLTQTGRREITHLLRSHDLSVSAIVCPLRRGLDVAQDLEPRLEQIRQTMALAFDL